MRSPDVKGSLNQKLPPQPLLAPVSRYSSKNTILAKCWLNYLIFNYSTVRWWARLLRRGKFCSEFLCILMSCCIEWMRTKPIFLPSFFSPMPMPPMSSSCARETWHDGWLSLLNFVKEILSKKIIVLSANIYCSQSFWRSLRQFWTVKCLFSQCENRCFMPSKSIVIFCTFRSHFETNLATAMTHAGPGIIKFKFIYTTTWQYGYY